MDATEGWTKRYKCHSKVIGEHRFQCLECEGWFELRASCGCYYATRATLSECQELAHATAALWKGGLMSAWWTEEVAGDWYVFDSVANPVVLGCPQGAPVFVVSSGGFFDAEVEALQACAAHNLQVADAVAGVKAAKLALRHLPACDYISGFEDEGSVAVLVTMLCDALAGGKDGAAEEE